MHLPNNVRIALEKWLRDNAAEVSRNMTLSEACVRATKAVGCRVHRNNMEDAAIAIGFTGFNERQSHAAQVAPPPSASVAAVTPLATAANSQKDDDEHEEVIQLATEFAMLKRRILTQSAKVEEAKRFAEEAAGVHQTEQNALQILVKEQHRIRTVLKEAMEV